MGNSIITLALIGSVSGGILAIWRVFRGLVRAYNLLHTIFDQIVPNGGTSLRDAVDRIEVMVSIQRSELDVLSGRVSGLESNGSVYPNG